MDLIERRVQHWYGLAIACHRKQPLIGPLLFVEGIYKVLAVPRPSHRVLAHLRFHERFLGTGAIRGFLVYPPLAGSERCERDLAAVGSPHGTRIVLRRIE